jgi:hypothetical protein
MYSLVASCEVDHLIGSAMVSGAGMDKDTGDIAELPSSLAGTGEHGGCDSCPQAAWNESQQGTEVMLELSGRDLAADVLNNKS